MKSLLAPVRSGNGPDRADRAAELLIELRDQFGEVSLEELWNKFDQRETPHSAESLTLLVECIKTDLRARFEAGQTPQITEYLERFPELRQANSRVLSLIYEEYCLIEQRGEAVNVDTFCERYQAWKSSLVSQLQYHHLFSQATGISSRQPTFPEVGQDFQEFRLLSLIGKGGTSRVFLASDLALGGKQVVLKVSLDRGQEPLAQGALDHPHIVPVNSVVFADNELRGLSMPFRPGRPLDEIIKDLATSGPPRRAIDLWNALTRSDKPLLIPTPDGAVRGGAAPPLPRGDAWAGFPIHGTYARGVAWIVMIIARALAYAHERRTFHRDVKPGNILLAYHHGPQLFDFNLAASPHTVEHAELAMNGGTLPYMAPEQIQAFIIPELWKEVGPPADIYSLGLVLRELLIGLPPELPPPGLSAQSAISTMFARRPFIDTSLRRHDPKLPVALEVIVSRCLAYEPDRRYPTADALATDLECFLEHRPLKTEKNPSRRERFVDWSIRNRLSLGVSSAVASLALLALVPSAIDALKPPIDSLSAFPEALHALERHQPARASKLLNELEKHYPHSARLQLSLAALDEENKDHAQAARHFQAATSCKPDPSENLVAWLEQHPALVPSLIRFSDHCLDAGGTAETINEAALLQAHTALTLVTSAFPNSHEAYVGLSRCHELNKRYNDAYHAISTAIKLAVSSDDTALSLLFNYRALRIRHAAKLASELRQKGSNDALVGAASCLDELKHDFKLCDRASVGLDIGKNQEYFYLANKLEALLVRAEIEVSRAQYSLALRDIQEIDPLFKSVQKLAAQVDADITEKTSDWHRRTKLVRTTIHAHSTAAK